MLGRRVRLQLVVFAVIAVLSVALASLYYAKLPRLFGIGQYEITAVFDDASGLYPNALVNERGVDIGLVRDVALTDDGVKVTMTIDDGRKLAKDSTVYIHATSAIGEQYVDFVSNSTDGPYYDEGDTVPRRHTRGMPSSAALLDSADDLLRSLPTAKIKALLDEVDTAFGGTGDDLRRLISSSRSLAGTASANIGPTVRLLQVAQPFLTTQLDLTAQTSRYVSNLVSFTNQLVTSRSTISSILNRFPDFSRQVKALTDELTPTLPVLFANLLTVGGVAKVYLPSIKQLLVLLPLSAEQILSALSPPDAKQLNAGKLGFKGNVQDPPPCTQGYLPPSQQRDSNDLRRLKYTPDLFCNVPNDDPRNVRGAHNQPCLEHPGTGLRGARPTICDEKAGTKSRFNPPKSDTIPKSAADGYDPNAGYQNPGRTTRRTQAQTYEPTTGRFQAADGTFYVLGAGYNPKAKTPKTWQQLLLAPVGR